MPNQVRHLSERLLAKFNQRDAEEIGVTHEENFLKISLEPLLEFDVEAEGAVLVAEGDNGDVAAD